jgi:hypothetical protein
VRRENQDEVPSFHQSGKTRDAEWHEEETKDLPAVETGISARGAEHQSKTDDPRKSDRCQPQIAARIKLARDEEEVPDQVTPQDHLPSSKLREIVHQRGLSVLLEQAATP